MSESRRSSRHLLAVACAALLAVTPARAATLTFLSEVPAPSGVGFTELAVSPDGKHVYAYAGTGGDLVAYARDAGTGALSFVEEESMNVLSGFPLALSPDGSSVYASVFAFRRDAVTGELDVVQTFTTNPGTIDAVSPDGEHAYSATSTWGIGVWDRDPTDGSISVIETHNSPASFDPEHLAISADGAHVYVPDVESAPGWAVRAYARDAATGELETIQIVGGGTAKYRVPRSGRVYLSPDQAHVYLVVSDWPYPGGLGNEIAVLRRDPATGRLTFVQHLTMERCLSSDRACCRPDSLGLPHRMALEASGERVFVVNAGYQDFGEAGITVLGRDPGSGALTFLEILPKTALGAGTPIAATLSPDGLHLYVSTAEATVEVFAVGASPAAPLATECKLEGKSLTIRNAGPGDLLEAAKAVARDTTIVVPAPGSPDDPTCNGDAPGTVRATVRFQSDASGQDTGEIGLPCENWTTLGKVGRATFGYRYRDPARASGPCSDIKLMGTKLLKITCDNKGGAVLGYDLVEGTDEGRVSAVLTTATTRYCASFDDHHGKDGSDGKKFLGRSQPAPSSCP